MQDTFTLVMSTFVAPGRPSVRITRALRDASLATALAEARELADRHPNRRCRLLRIDGENSVLQTVWDSHPPC